MMQRFKTELNSGSMPRHTTYRDAETAEDAASAAFMGWRNDWDMVGEAKSGTDLYGDYAEYTARVGRYWASVKVRV